jgi:hypothetical protein
VTNRQYGQSDPAVTAVMHRAGGVWRVLIASRKNGHPSIIDARDFLSDDRARLEEHFVKLHVGRVICVLPAAAVVCRTCTLPDVDTEQLDQALRLQAEAHLLGNTPDYRTSMAVLPPAPGETSRSGIVLSWPLSAEVERPPTDRPVTYAPDIAGLAALLDGHRPPDPLMWLDRSTGSIALAVTHANGAIFRATRESAISSDDWRQRVSLALAETALSGGHSGAFVDSLTATHEATIVAMGREECKLSLPTEVRTAAAAEIAGVESSDQWWSHFGIACGVLLAAGSDLAPLTKLIDAPETEKPSRIMRAAEALARPRTATLTIISCLVLLALIVPAFSALRLAVLRMRYADIDQQVRLVNEAERQIALYQAMEDEAWSATKLLSDICCNTPEGIELQRIQLRKSDRSFAVDGKAIPYEGKTARDLVALMQKNLTETKLFGETTLDWSEPNAYRHIEFGMSAKVLRPHKPAEYDIERDFGRWTYADRRAGDPPPGGDEGTLASRPSSNDQAGGERRTTVSPGGDDAMAAVTTPPGGGDDVGTSEPEEDPEERSGRPQGGYADRPSSPGGPSRVTPEGRDPGKVVDLSTLPEPLTEEQINGMSKDELLNHLNELAPIKKRLRNSDNEEARQRIEREWDMVMARLREL